MESIQLMLWGNSLDDYCHIFDLKKDLLPASILDCSNLPSSFNAEVNHHNSLKTDVISCSNMYSLSLDILSKQSLQIFAKIDSSMEENFSEIKWRPYKTRDDFKNSRIKSVETFLNDYEKGLSEGRYIPVSSLTALPFEDNQFDLVLCCASLFNTNESTLDNCIDVIRELCRVANEARIYPLLDNQGKSSSLLGPVALALQEANYGLEIRQVDYDVIKGGNAMFRVWSQSCQVNS